MTRPEEKGEKRVPQFTPKQLPLVMGCVLVLDRVISNVVDKSLPIDVQDYIRINLARFLNHLIVNQTFKGKKEHTYVSMGQKFGAKHYPTVFGMISKRAFTSKIDGRKYVWAAPKRRAGDYNSNYVYLPRLLDIMLTKGFLRGTTYKAGAFNTGYKLSSELYTILLDAIPRKRKNMNLFVSLEEYQLTRSKTIGSLNPLGGRSIMEQLQEMPTTQRAIRNKIRERSILSYMDTNPRAKKSELMSTKVYKDLYDAATATPLPLDFTRVDDALDYMTSVERLNPEMTQELLAEVDVYFDKVLACIESDDSLERAHALSKKIWNRLDIKPEYARKAMRRAISDIQSIHTILNGTAYYNKREALVYYYPKYLARAQGGRSFEVGGGFQTLSKDMKQLIAGHTVINLDMRGAHFNILISLTKKYGLEKISPILMAATTFKDITKHFLAYSKANARRKIKTDKHFIDVSRSKLEKSYNELMDDLDTFSDLVKPAFFAALNNGGNPLKSSAQKGISVEILNALISETEDISFAKHGSKLFLMLFNDFCTEIRYYKLLSKLCDCVIADNHDSLYGIRIKVQNAVGLTKSYAVNSTGKTLLRDARVGLLNHVVTGYEVRAVHEFIMINGLRVCALEHDGIAVPAHSKVISYWADGHEFAVKPFSCIDWNLRLN